VRKLFLFIIFNSISFSQNGIQTSLACDRRIVDASFDFRNGYWKNKAYQFDALWSGWIQIQ